SYSEYGGLSLPGLLVGEYRADAYANLLSLWSASIRGADPAHPLIAGRQALPRAVIQVPNSYAGVVAAVAPPEVLPIDVARRAGRLVMVDLDESALRSAEQLQ